MVLTGLLPCSGSVPVGRMAAEPTATALAILEKAIDIRQLLRNSPGLAYLVHPAERAVLAAVSKILDRPSAAESGLCSIEAETASVVDDVQSAKNSIKANRSNQSAGSEPSICCAGKPFHAAAIPWYFPGTLERCASHTTPSARLATDR